MSGRLVIERIDYSGSLFAITQFSRHDILGGNLVYSAKPQYPWTITALEATSIARISGEDLFTVMCGHPDVLKYFLQMISENTQVLHEKITTHLNRTARERISNFLLRESERQKTQFFAIPCSKTRLAEMLGIQRTSLSRELARMKVAGLLDFNGREFKIFTLKDDIDPQCR
jgi:CRP-like cAMP-binding protein